VLSTEGIDKGGKEGGKSHTVRVRQFSGKGLCLANLPQCLIWITQQAETHTIKRKDSHCGVLSVYEGLGTTLLGVIPGDPVLAIGFGCSTFSKTERDFCQPSVSPELERGVL
jgi:hypothetical protein